MGTPTENELIEDFLKDNDLPYIWSSGRLCNFKGCDREDLQPATVNGWFWSGSGVTWLPPTPPRQAGATSPGPSLDTRLSSSPTTSPSRTTQSSTLTGPEACMGVLNDIYDDGIKWHGIA